MAHARFLSKTGPMYLAMYLAMLCWMFTSSTWADSITIAVAANFSNTLKILVQDFKSQNNSDIKLVSGSTGKLYFQITQGAPYDIFFAADEQTPTRLVDEKLAKRATSYARGKLVIYSKNHLLPEQKTTWTN